MLYVTTRNKHDVYTAKWSVEQDRGSDGGLFVPFHLPCFEKAQILELGSRSFGENVAHILNLLYSTKLTAWDVEITVGRHLLKIHSAGLRIFVGELFHNSDGNFRRAVNALAARIHPDGELLGAPSNWLQIGVRIAVLFGVYGQLLKDQRLRYEKPLVLAVPSGNFGMPMAAWYARSMGLPVGTIVCGCNENGAPWDLLHRGVLDTTAIAVETTTPECDVAVPENLERLICACLGQEEALRYWWTCAEGRSYEPLEAHMEELRKGMFAAVVSQERVLGMITSVYRSCGYILDPYTALAYGALTDYRSRTGAAATALVWMESSPMCNSSLVSQALQISDVELKNRLFPK